MSAESVAFAPGEIVVGSTQYGDKPSDRRFYAGVVAEGPTSDKVVIDVQASNDPDVMPGSKVIVQNPNDRKDFEEIMREAEIALHFEIENGVCTPIGFANEQALDKAIGANFNVKVE